VLVINVSLALAQPSKFAQAAMRIQLLPAPAPIRCRSEDAYNVQIFREK
jgi:hypothetical protein